MTPVSCRWPWLVVAVLSAGCESDPDRTVFVYGRALQADGSPLSNTAFTMERRPEMAQPHASGTPPAFTPYKTVMTAPSGAFTLDLPTADAEERLPWGLRPYRFRACISTSDEAADGAMALASFTFNAGDIELPALSPWDAALTVTGGTPGPSIQISPPPPAPTLPPSAKLPPSFNELGEVQLAAPTLPQPIVQLSSGGGLLWQETREPGPWTVPPRVLEDFAAPRARLRALSLGKWLFEPLWGGASEVTFRLEWRTPRAALPPGTLRPISRGAACVDWKESRPCPWTDGLLTPERLGGKPGQATELGIILAAPTHLSHAVIRGLQAEEAFFPDQTLIIEGSGNGADWSPLASLPIPPANALRALSPFAFGKDWAADNPLDGPLVVDEAPLFVDVPLSSEATVRQVRLRVERWDGTPVELGALSEFSVFD